MSLVSVPFSATSLGTGIRRESPQMAIRALLLSLSLGKPQKHLVGSGGTAGLPPLFYLAVHRKEMCSLYDSVHVKF